MSIIRFLVVITTLFIFSSNLYSGWFDKGKDILNSINVSSVKKSNELSETDIAAGLKDALKVGTENVVKILSKPDGFLKDKAVHIHLPEKLQKLKNTLSKIGMASSLKTLEIKLNRAAEIATPKAKKIFWGAISSMTLEDVKKIYNGPEDAATKYFKSKMSIPLMKAMKPVIDKSLSQVNAVRVYNSILEKYNSLPFVNPVHGDISTYTLKKALQGIFYYLAKEEAAIRENPAKRTTEILKKVFRR